MKPPPPPNDARSLEALVARDHPPCPVCRRALGTLVPTAESGALHCPHCRTRLRCTLDPRGSLGIPWLVGMLAASLAGGFHLLTAPLFLEAMIQGDLRPGAVAPWTAGLVAGVALMLGWLLGRHRIRRWSWRGTLLAAAATLLIGAASVFLLAW